MEQIILLILFLALPGLIRKLTGAQKRGAPRKARPAPSPRDEVEVEAPTEVEETLPGWLRELSETLSEHGGRHGEVVEEAEPIIESVPISSPVDLDPPMPAAPIERDHSVHLGQVKAPPRRQLHHGNRAARYLPSGRGDWRRAVVLSEVLGNPRGLKRWREAGGES